MDDIKFIHNNAELVIVDKIAEGGQGTVYKARQKGVEGFEKTVAIKTLNKANADNDAFKKMFVDEAKLVANLVHENIVQIYQLGKHDDFYYFVLEYVKGVSLFELFRFHVELKIKIPRELAVFITSRIARGLAYAHSRKDSYGQPLNIVHCDVCPHNILITTEGLPKLTDFGIAKATSILYEQKSVSGKLPYMSPEQANLQAVDFRSDIYSLGTVLFALLAGESCRKLYNGLEDILIQARNNEIQWDHLPDDLDTDLLDIIKKMLATDPGDRYQSTDQLGRDLEYHIYKDGYGPTVVSLEEYMRKQMPTIFHEETLDDQKTVIDKTVIVKTTVLADKTVLMK